MKISTAALKHHRLLDAVGGSCSIGGKRVSLCQQLIPAARVGMFIIRSLT